MSNEATEDERTIVIGYDGSPHSEDGLALGEVLAGALEARPLIVTVVPYPDHLIPADERETIAGDWAAPALKLATDRLRALEPRAVALADDSPAHALNELAETKRPLLIAIGSTHRSPLGRVFLGDVGEGLLSGAPCAIAVAPRGYADRDDHRLQRIGVAINGSAESSTAFQTALSMAKRLDATLTVIAVAEPPRYGYGASLAILTASEYESAEHKHATEVLAEAEGRAGPDVTLIRLLRSGPPEQELAAAGEQLDLLVLGSRGYGPLRRTLMGGVSAKLMRLAPCPTLVLPRQAGDDPLALQAGG